MEVINIITSIHFYKTETIWYEHFVRPTPFEVSITICKVD